MPNGEQVKVGKAFEYACLQCLAQKLPEAKIINNQAYSTAKGFYESRDSALKTALNHGAEAGIRIILDLEPRLQRSKKPIQPSSPNYLKSISGDGLYLSLQTDDAGIAGDVRDIICKRPAENWEIGFSCKHGNEDAKHSRLSDKNDFGLNWLGYRCSDQYWSTIRPIFQTIRLLKQDNPSMLWRDYPDLHEKIYRPILQSFMDELILLDKLHPGEIAFRLSQYLVGTKDYYKIISFDSKRYTRIEGFNMNGTLNKSAGIRPILTVPHLEFPTKFYHLGIPDDEPNWLYIVCDGGWNFGIRIHTARSIIEPSLKLAVSIDSRPIKSMHVQVEPWNRIYC